MMTHKYIVECALHTSEKNFQWRSFSRRIHDVHFKIVFQITPHRRMVGERENKLHHIVCILSSYIKGF